MIGSREISKRKNLPANRRFLTILVATIVNGSVASATALALEPLPPGMVPPPGAPPPPGSGPNPPPLIQGDAAPLPPPTGRADPGSGSWFPTAPATSRVSDSPARYRTRDGRGIRMVLPDREPGRGPGTWTDDFELERLQNQQYPWPESDMNGPVMTRRVETPAGPRTEMTPTKFISLDLPGRINYQPNESWRTHEQQRSPLPTVRLFCRILVILGVVFATIYMAFAAWGVILGHKDAGQRVIGSAGGLMLLLMGYSIYKLVMIHAFLFPNSPTVTATPGPAPARQALQPAQTPITPGARRSGRSNMPVVPLGGSVNR